MFRKVLFILFIVCVGQGLCAQLHAQLRVQRNIDFDFPLLAEHRVCLYYFSGSKVDSLSVKLNNEGKANISFPDENYRGMCYLYIAGAGSGEFLLAEPYLKISCSEEKFNAQMLDFGQSIENIFLQKTFTRRSSLLDRQEWLQESRNFELNEEDKTFFEKVSLLIKENDNALKALNKSLAASTLYAARFIELTSFMQRLYATVQNPDAETQGNLQNEFQYRLDINALYHAGNLWNDVHKYYGGLFVTAADVSDVSEFNEENDKAYALSLKKTMIRLPEPVRIAFFSSSIAACERSNRPHAAEIIIKDFLESYPDLSAYDSNMQRLFNRYRVGEGSKAPDLEGLNNAIEQPALLFFYDSDCEHCRNEAEWLVEHYEELIEKGYRIISIAADTKTNSYDARLPWNKSDKLCDFKGFKGDNFRNYGVIGTPAIFELDENCIIVGRYAQAKEIFD